MRHAVGWGHKDQSMSGEEEVVAEWYLLFRAHEHRRGMI